ncbi:hypothetical protein CVT26_008487 [Gymnopilus dilepis]|uniref:HIT domain-containing protein n=1 Tax=Gymnopilus dilepis TaxID=231916 RepID=A0A409XXI1_9AGAR|nr:hypothetical protein CVT26_008487 [Gymnopilus dilepis]
MSEAEPLDAPEFCKFCNTSVERGFNIVYEDAAFVAFEDRKPASRYHYLVVPKRHIGKVFGSCRIFRPTYSQKASVA